MKGLDIETLKIYTMNTGAMAISFTQIEMALKLILLLLTIGYTARKWYELHKNNNNKS